MDSGQIELAQLRSLLSDQADPAWMVAVAGPVAEEVAPLWRADVIVGPSQDQWEEKAWAYESCTFLSGPLPVSLLTNLTASGSISRISLAGFNLELELQTNGSFQRKPSFAQHDLPLLPLPSVVYTMNLVQPPQQFQAPPGFLIGPGAPSFVTFGVGFNAFFYDNYALTGTNNPLLGQMLIRVCDLRGRVTSVDIQSTQLEVAVEGDELDQASVEMMAASDRAVVAVSAGGHAVIPLPHGLPDDAWIWLRSDDDWFDYRSLGGWAAYRSPDVRDTRPPEPVVNLMAMIAQGENLHVEFKSQLPSNTPASRRTALKSVVAFANGEGGTLLYGIADDGTIPGLAKVDSTSADGFVNVLRASTSPMPPCHCSIEELEGREILVVDVEANAGTIFALTVEADKPEFFVRRGATTFPARAEELQAIIRRDQSNPQAASWNNPFQL